MPTRVEWVDAEQTILLYVFEDPWTWPEMYVILNQSWNMLESGEGPVDSIVDMQHGRNVPMNVMAQFIRLARVQHPRTRLRILVSGGGMMMTMLNLFVKIYNKPRDHYHFADTREEAFAIIRAKRSENHDA